MKKYLMRLGLVGTLTFFAFLVYFYRTSGKFRQSVLSAFVAVTFVFSMAQPARAGQVNAFTQQNQNHQSRFQNQGIFSRNPNNYDSGPGKPNDDGSGGDDNGIPKYLKTESVEETQRHLSDMDKQIHQLEEVTDSESEIETESECKSVEQLQVDESYKSNLDLKKVTKNAHKSKQAVKNLEDVKQKLSEGDNPLKIGYESSDLGNGFYYIIKPNARIIVKVDPITGNSDIVAFGLRSNKNNMKKLVTVVNSQCNTKIKINPKAY